MPMCSECGVVYAHEDRHNKHECDPADIPAPGEEISAAGKKRAFNAWKSTQ